MIDHGGSFIAVEGQIVLVSGGSRGIGQAIASAFVQRGARVVITGRDSESLTKALDTFGQTSLTPEAIVCDVSRMDDIQQTVDQIQQKHGQIDTLINVAGVNRRKPSLEVTEEDYDFIMDINLKGAFLLSQAVGRLMIERGSGSQILSLIHI